MLEYLDLKLHGRENLKSHVMIKQKATWPPLSLLAAIYSRPYLY